MMIKDIFKPKIIRINNSQNGFKKKSGTLWRVIEKKPLLPMLLFVFIFGVIKAPYFFSLGNVQNISSSIPLEGIIAVGMTFVILTGGIDLSVGSMMALIIVVIGKLLNAGVNEYVSILIGIALGAGIGFINGVGIAKAKVPPFIVTLATMISLRGVALIITDGYIISLSNKYLLFDKLAWSNIGPISSSAFILIGILVLAAFLLKYTNFGRAVYAVGGDMKAALLSGFKVDFYLIMVYVISGITCGIASVIWLSISVSANPSVGVWTNLNTIAMVCIGGTSVFGGRGTIWGTALGILLMGIIVNIFDLMGIAPWYKDMIVAMIILVALGLIKGNKGIITVS